MDEATQRRGPRVGSRRGQRWLSDSCIKCISTTNRQESVGDQPLDTSGHGSGVPARAGQPCGRLSLRGQCPGRPPPVWTPGGTPRGFTPLGGVLGAVWPWALQVVDCREFTIPPGRPDPHSLAPADSGHLLLVSSCGRAGRQRPQASVTGRRELSRAAALCAGLPPWRCAQWGASGSDIADPGFHRGDSRGAHAPV